MNGPTAPRPGRLSTGGEFGIRDDAQRIAVAQRPGLIVDPDIIHQWVLFNVVHKWIIGRRLPIFGKAQDLAGVGLHILRGCEFLPLSGGHPQITV